MSTTADVNLLFSNQRERVASFDWKQTPLGPQATWPPSLRTAADLVLASPVPMLLLWGPEAIAIYNDAYAAIAGKSHPHLLGRSALNASPGTFNLDRFNYERVRNGEPLSFKDRLFVCDRSGANEEAWMDVSFTPVPADDGSIGGVLEIALETTQRLRAEAALQESDARFKVLADNISQLAWMADPAGYIFWYNKRWFDYTGTTIDEMRGWGWRAVHHPEHVDRVVEKISHCFDSGENWEDTFPLRGRDGNYRWFLSRAMPIRNEAGKVTRWFGTNTDITEQRAEADRNALLAAIVSTSADAIISLSSNGIILSWNPGAERMLGYTADEVVGTSERILFAEDAEKEFREKYELLRRGESFLRDTVRRRKDGTFIDVAINAAPLRSPDGRIIGYSAILRDMTERKRAENHLRVVLRELSHRTKNLLAVIIAMVRQTARTSKDVGALQSQLMQRLHGMSASHDLLVAEDWAGAPLRDLVNALLNPFKGDSGSAFDVDGPDVFVTTTAAQNLGLALHELATNAAKYGALSLPSGRVKVRWALVEGENAERVLNITWKEEGGPRVEPPTVKGFGHVVVERVVSQALKATVAYDFHPSGVEWSVIVPAEFIVWQRTRSQQSELGGERSITGQSRQGVHVDAGSKSPTTPITEVKS